MLRVARTVAVDVGAAALYVGHADLGLMSLGKDGELHLAGCGVRGCGGAGCGGAGWGEVGRGAGWGEVRCGEVRCGEGGKS